jgi:hypothetical protein
VELAPKRRPRRKTPRRRDPGESERRSMASKNREDSKKKETIGCEQSELLRLPVSVYF